MSRKPIAFVGVGAIGLPMALRLNAAEQVIAVEPFEKAREAAASQGLTVVANVNELPELSHALIMVATPDQVKDVVLTNNLVAKVEQGGSIVVMSTVGVESLTELAQALENSGIHIIDAPVTGGVTGAQSGKLKLYVAGEDAPVKELDAVFRSFGEPLDAGTEPGQGQAAKLVNNLLVTTHLVAAAEALNFAEKMNLDTEKILTGLLGGAAYSWSLSEFGPEMLKSEPSMLRAMLRIFMKDSDLILEAGANNDVMMPVISAVKDVLNQAHTMDLDMEDSSSVIEVYRANASVGVK